MKNTKKNILIISSKVSLLNKSSKSKFFFSLIKELKRRRFYMDFYSIIKNEYLDFDVIKKYGLKILDKIELKNYKYVLFDSAEIPVNLYRKVKSSSDGITILLSNKNTDSKRKFDYIVKYEDLDKVFDILKERNNLKFDKLSSIIILTFNQLKLTKKCFESLRENTLVPYEVIFVDNGSTDGTIKWIKKLEEENKNVRVFLNKKNLGFSKANNIGIKNAKGDYVVLLNNDVILTKDWLKGLIKCAESDDDIGLVGPCSNEAAGVQKVNVKYKLKQLKSFSYAWRMKNLGIWKEVHRLNAFCLLIKKKVIESVGLLDEDFGPGGYEDYDYCLRVRHAGFKIYLAKDVYVHHIGGQGYWPNQLDYNKLRANNVNIFVNKWVKKYLQILETLPDGI